MSSRMIAYGRVSSETQNLNYQLEMFKKYGVQERDCYFEKKSGKDTENREQYQIVKKILREGDLLVIASIDRLSRSYVGLYEEWHDITRNIKADIVVLDMPLLDTRNKKDLLGSFINDLILQLLGYIAQVEREKILSRQKVGISTAMKYGTKTGRPFGRPKKERPINFDEVFNKWINKEITARKAMQELDLTANVFYKFVHEKEERM